MTRNQFLITLVAIAIIAAAIAVYFLWSPGASSDAITASGPGTPVTLQPDDRTLGNAKAKVLMVEYAAPSCPHCAHFDETIFPLLKKNYIDTGKVYYVFRVFPLSQVDGAAEAMARCLPADNYFQFIDLMFRNQPKWDPEYGVTDPHEGLIEMGRIVGMSADQVDKCIGDKNALDRINKVATEGMTKYNISATPTFVIDGQVHSGAYTWQDLQTFLDSQLKKK
ncbi:MAG TPA: thioredoxin domain-containing protein [Rhizomicrobium sp.]|nr:thioredoxin domain-containing protein [Rhizomicrobium sp.]